MGEKEVESLVARTISRIMIPFIQLFGIYVIVHGETSPGGGFQGGVILGTSMILYGIVYGLSKAKKRVSKKHLIILISLGVLIYSGIGLMDMLSGGKYLQYDSLPLPVDAHETTALSILGVELGIGLTVMSATIILFIYLAGERIGAGMDNW
ncbi:MAG: hypothetical protein B6U97_00660 [Candidatus Altiarchaeales archaeon ex4484_96]|nr:MAG: hypothetical protein B6U97_00660 [Candidatus Altiarchaeales archaeon ex4484_96]